jgi:hypothetical protein
MSALYPAMSAARMAANLRLTSAGFPSPVGMRYPNYRNVAECEQCRRSRTNSLRNLAAITYLITGKIDLRLPT